MTAIDFSSFPGKASHLPEFDFIREMDKQDIDIAVSIPQAQHSSGLSKIRDRHHWIARLVAQEKSNVEICALTGMGLTRIGMLRQDPAFQELVAHYYSHAREYYVDMLARLKMLSGIAIEELMERIETSPEEFTVKDLKSLAEMALDRSGHGPSSNLKVTTINGLDLLKELREQSRTSSAEIIIPRGTETTEESQKYIEGELVRPPELLQNPANEG